MFRDLILRLFLEIKQFSLYVFAHLGHQILRAIWFKKKNYSGNTENEHEGYIIQKDQPTIFEQMFRFFTLLYRTLLYYIHFNFTLTALLTLVCLSGEIRDKKKENRLHKKAPLIIEGIIQMTIELQTNIWWW